ncbi:MAG: transglycosylase family protein [Actinobacteria bacterium]|nr:transglycosylase family protein [Actinomycetota bacterium]
MTLPTPLVWFALFAACVVFWASAAWGVTEAWPASKCASVKQCHHDLAWAKHERQVLRHRLAVRYQRDATYAIRLAAAAFGVPEHEMRTIARCESGMGAQVTAEAGSGASGVFQFLGSTWRRTPFASFDVFDPVANSLAAAQLVRRDGSWREWSCSSITGVR